LLKTNMTRGSIKGPPLGPDPACLDGKS